MVLNRSCHSLGIRLRHVCIHFYKGDSDTASEVAGEIIIDVLSRNLFPDSVFVQSLEGPRGFESRCGWKLGDKFNRNRLTDKISIWKTEISAFRFWSNKSRQAQTSQYLRLGTLIHLGLLTTVTLVCSCSLVSPGTPFSPDDLWDIERQVCIPFWIVVLLQLREHTRTSANLQVVKTGSPTLEVIKRKTPQENTQEQLRKATWHMLIFFVCILAHFPSLAWLVRLNSIFDHLFISHAERRRYLI